MSRISPSASPGSSLFSPLESVFARIDRYGAWSADLPLRVAHLSSIWTLTFTEPSRYNWMLQYYLRDHGLALSWVGTGRFIFSLNFTEADFEDMLERCVQAGHQMQRDGWWWQAPGLTNKAIKRGLLREMLGQIFKR